MRARLQGPGSSVAGGTQDAFNHTTTIQSIGAGGAIGACGAVSTSSSQAAARLSGAGGNSPICDGEIGACYAVPEQMLPSRSESKRSADSEAPTCLDAQTVGALAGPGDEPPGLSGPSTPVQWQQQRATMLPAVNRPDVDPQQRQVAELQDMGFSKPAAEVALALSGNSLEAAVGWLLDPGNSEWLAHVQVGAAGVSGSTELAGRIRVGVGADFAA